MSRPQSQSSSLNPATRSGAPQGQSNNQQSQFGTLQRPQQQQPNTSPTQSRASGFFSSFRKNSIENKGEKFDTNLYLAILHSSETLTL
jgi:hypothetical protein